MRVLDVHRHASARQSAGGRDRRRGPERRADGGLHAGRISETTFLLPPTDPPPTTGCRSSRPAASCSSVIRRWAAPGPAGRGRRAAARRRVVQECGVGRAVRRVDVNGQARRRDWPSRRHRCDAAARPDAETVAQALAALRLAAPEVLQVEWIDNGPAGSACDWRMRRRCALQPDFATMAAAGLKIARRRRPPGRRRGRCRVRAFVPELGVPEDPVTGSLNAGLAQWLTGAGLLPACYVAGQGPRSAATGESMSSASRQARTPACGSPHDVVGCVSGTLRLWSRRASRCSVPSRSRRISHPGSRGGRGGATGRRPGAVALFRRCRRRC